MAEWEEEVIDDVADVTEENNENTDNEFNDDNQEEVITWEQAQEWKKKAERLDRAEKKLVELKKASKTQSKEVDWVVTQADLDLRDSISDFVFNNPELKEYKSELTKYVKQWFTLKQAKALIENDDKTIEQRKKTNSMNISSSEWWPWKTSFTKAELASMSQYDYNKATDMIASWKASIR